MTKWNDNIEKVLKSIEKKCYINSKKHDKIANNSDKMYSYLMITSIMISPLSGIIDTIGTMVVKDVNSIIYFSIPSTILSFIAGILITVTKFNNYSEKSQSHLVASSRYISLENNIKRQLLLDQNDRLPANEYIEWVMKNYDNLYMASPLVDEKNNNIIEALESQLELGKKYEYELQKEKNMKSHLFTSIHDLKKYDDIKTNLDIKKREELIPDVSLA